MAASDNDWRLTNQMRFMKGVALAWRAYEAPSATWDHDHCEFCGQKFMQTPVPASDIQSEGYVTQDGEDRWVCGECFEDFRERFGWTVEA